MRKLTAVLLSICLLLFCLSACTDKVKDTEDTKEPTENTDTKDTTKPTDSSDTEKPTEPESSTEPQEITRSGNDKGIELPKIRF